MTINALKVLNLRPRNRTGGDCVVLALTFLTGVPYTDAEDYVKIHQSRYMSPEGTRAHGVYTESLLRGKTNLLGHRFTPVNVPAFQTLGAFIEANPSGSFLVCRQSHALSVRDGQIFDVIDSHLGHRVHCVWRVEKI